ncbi:MAG: hypothetical protein ACP5QG_02575 [candidate division WOR-3 bacterium]
MMFVALFMAIRSETVTVTDLSILQDTVVSNLLMDERMKVFYENETVVGIYQGLTSEFLVVNVGEKLVWLKRKEVDSLLVFLPLQDRVIYTRKDRFMVSLAGAAFTEITALAITAAMSDELKDKLSLPILALSPFLGLALAQTAVGSPEKHPSTTKTRLFLLLTEGKGMGEGIKAPEE